MGRIKNVVLGIGRLFDFSSSYNRCPKSKKEESYTKVAHAISTAIKDYEKENPTILDWNQGKIKIRRKR